MVRKPDNHGEAVRPGTALHALGVKSQIVREMGGNANMHWLVRDGNGRELVLRRYGPWRTLESVNYEVQLLKLLAPKWPVPVAVVEPILVGQHVWSLFVRMPGRPTSSRSPSGRSDVFRRQGRLLAELHLDMVDVRLGQRPGFVRADEVFGVRDDGPTIGEILRNPQLVDPVVGARLLEYAERAKERFITSRGSPVQSMVIHGDLNPLNTLYLRGSLTGIIDFDFAHWDFFVADFAFVWWGRNDEVIEGYEEVRPLSEAEKSLLAPSFWARLLDGIRIGRMWPTTPGPRRPIALLQLLEHRSGLHDW